MRVLLLSALVLSCSATITTSSGSLVVSEEPPAPRVTIRGPVPFPDSVWIEGHWVWNGERYTWRDGEWDRAQSGSHYVQGHWQARAEGWVYVEGGWVHMD